MKPDLTFVLDVPADVGLARATKRRGTAPADRFEGEALEFHERLRAAYRDLAANEPDRCMLIDVTAPRDKVAQQIWNLVDIRLRPKIVQSRRKVAP
jgi:dTMP kinase